LLDETTYLKYYIEYIVNLEKQLKAELHLAIMTSDDTHHWTLKYLKENDNFGLN